MKIKLLVAITLLVVLTACATLALTPKDRALLRDYDDVTFSDNDINILKKQGLNPNQLTPQQKVAITRDWKDLQAALLY